jgi:hypothetical protein
MYQDENERELEGAGFRISDDEDEPLELPDEISDFDNEDNEFDKDH